MAPRVADAPPAPQYARVAPAAGIPAGAEHAHGIAAPAPPPPSRTRNRRGARLSGGGGDDCTARIRILPRPAHAAAPLARDAPLARILRRRLPRGGRLLDEQRVLLNRRPLLLNHSPLGRRRGPDLGALGSPLRGRADDDADLALARQARVSPGRGGRGCGARTSRAGGNDRVGCGGSTGAGDVRVRGCGELLAHLRLGGTAFLDQAAEEVDCEEEQEDDDDATEEQTCDLA